MKSKQKVTKPKFPSVNLQIGLFSFEYRQARLLITISKDKRALSEKWFLDCPDVQRLHMKTLFYPNPEMLMRLISPTWDPSPENATFRNQLQNLSGFTIFFVSRCKNSIWYWALLRDQELSYSADPSSATATPLTVKACINRHWCTLYTQA